MSVRSLESSICADARLVFCNSKLRVKDIREWSTGPVKAQEGEVVAKVSGYYVAIFKEHDKRK